MCADNRKTGLEKYIMPVLGAIIAGLLINNTGQMGVIEQKITGLEKQIELRMRDPFTGTEGTALTFRVVATESAIASHEERIDEVERVCVSLGARERRKPND